jgi:hypothetical protein
MGTEGTMKLETEKVLVASTAHITEEDNFLLERCGEDNTLVVYSTEFFFLIPLNQEFGNAPELKFSLAFARLFDFAKTHKEKFTHLKLDCDGSLIEGFDQFDW